MDAEDRGDGLDGQAQVVAEAGDQDVVGDVDAAVAVRPGAADGAGPAAAAPDACLARTHLREIGDHTVVVYDIDTGAATELEVEAVVMATGRRADLGLGYELAGRAEQVFSIGDALSPRGLTAAIQDGHRFARAVGETDGPRSFTDLYFAPPDFSTYQRTASVLLAE